MPLFDGEAEAYLNEVYQRADAFLLGRVHGSGALVRWLLANQLVDEIVLLTYPVVIGQGTGCFPTAARTSRSTWSTREPPRGG